MEPWSGRETLPALFRPPTPPERGSGVSPAHSQPEEESKIDTKETSRVNRPHTHPFWRNSGPGPPNRLLSKESLCFRADVVFHSGFCAAGPNREVFAFPAARVKWVFGPEPPNPRPGPGLAGPQRRAGEALIRGPISGSELLCIPRGFRNDRAPVLVSQATPLCRGRAGVRLDYDLAEVHPKHPGQRRLQTHSFPGGLWRESGGVGVSDPRGPLAGGCGLDVSTRLSSHQIAGTAGFPSSLSLVLLRKSH